MRVKILDEKIVGLVAAGEVIDNPSNIVKELIENSIDAGAKCIKIEIYDSKDLIRITDDGDGFESEDIAVSFKEHATSKINKIEDLYLINSYGFRGEALPSIAAVSKVKLITKKRGMEFGYKYVNEFGKEISIEKYPSNVGTSFEITDIFGNIPVRKKFLKSPSKENSLIVDLVYKFSISRPEIMFEIYYNDRLKYSTKGDNNLKNVLYNIYGNEVFENLIEINKSINGIKIFGYIAKPIIARNNKDDLIYFVNSRIVRHKIIDKAIIDGYKGYFMKNKYPLVVLHIDIEPSFVDVNIHPKKIEIKFNNDETIYIAIYDLLINTLKENNLIFTEKLSDNIEVISNENEFKEIISEHDIDKLPSLSLFDENVQSIDTKKNIEHSQFAKKDNINTSEFNNKHNLNLYDDSFNNSVTSKNIINKQSFIDETIPQIARDYRLVGQIFKTYILIEFNEKLYIIDQHAAHEKINYEKLIKSYKNNSIIKQNIFPPLLLKLSAVSMENVKKYINVINKLGFEIELFGDFDIRVSTIPYLLIDTNIKDVLCEVIDELGFSSNADNIETIVDKFATIACKKSIKANMDLSELQIRSLIKDLFNLDNPFNCPHGRPTIVEFSKNEFEKRFGRIV